MATKVKLLREILIAGKVQKKGTTVEVDNGLARTLVLRKAAEEVKEVKAAEPAPVKPAKAPESEPPKVSEPPPAKAAEKPKK